MVYGTAKIDDSNVLAKAIEINRKYLPKEKAREYAEQSFKDGCARAQYLH
jgi:hypothetical protein